MDLFEELNAKTKELDEEIQNFKSLGRKVAEAERNYKTELAKVCLRMKSDGFAVGLIDKVCYGEEKVADARFERDFAQTCYDASHELIQSIKLQIRVIENQIQREWR